ncbi:MAG: recombination-associated protein RdgC [Rhodoferax sp.]|nr:recombination-associated protein RdgC [Rhodoferax sp.]
MFKNVMMYRMLSPWTVTAAQLETALESARYVECSGSQEKAVGWVEPRGKAHGALVEVVGGQWILKLMVETKVLPASVVKRRAQEQLAQIEASTGRKPGKKEAREILEDARMSLLPMAFTKQGATVVWIDPQAMLLVLDAGSQGRADEVMTCLVNAIEGFAVQLINTEMSPAAAMAHWLGTKEAPAGFSVDRECELKAADESKAVVRYTRHALDTDEVTEHIAMGKMPTRLALTWNEHVSFVLTEALQLKKVAILDVVFEAAAALASDGKDDNFDGDVAIATGELQKLIPDLLEALGGEVLPIAAA